jgi:hypothetical protein
LWVCIWVRYKKSASKRRKNRAAVTSMEAVRDRGEQRLIYENWNWIFFFPLLVSHLYRNPILFFSTFFNKKINKI